MLTQVPIRSQRSVLFAGQSCAVSSMQAGELERNMWTTELQCPGWLWRTQGIFPRQFDKHLSDEKMDADGRNGSFSNHKSWPLICIIWADRTQFEHTDTISRPFLCIRQCYCACLPLFLCHMLLQPWACRWQSRRVHGCCNSSLAGVDCGRQWCPDFFFCKKAVEYDVLQILVDHFLHSGMEKWRCVDIWGVKLKKFLRSRCQIGHVRPTTASSKISTNTIALLVIYPWSFVCFDPWHWGRHWVSSIQVGGWPTFNAGAFTSQYFSFRSASLRSSLWPHPSQHASADWRVSDLNRGLSTACGLRGELWRLWQKSTEAGVVGKGGCYRLSLKQEIEEPWWNRSNRSNRAVEPFGCHEFFRSESREGWGDLGDGRWLVAGHVFRASTSFILNCFYRAL